MILILYDIFPYNYGDYYRIIVNIFQIDWYITNTSNNSTIISCRQLEKSAEDNAMNMWSPPSIPQYSNTEKGVYWTRSKAFIIMWWKQI